MSLIARPVGSLEVSVATGASGPVLVLAGEADFTSITRLDGTHRPGIRAGGAADNRRSEPALRRFGVDENAGDGSHKGQDPGGQRDAAGSAASG
jgi:hypothetical protein